MKYTGYLVIPAAALSQPAFDKYIYEDRTYDAEGDLVETKTVHPTWQQQLFEQNPKWHAPRRVKTASGEFVVFKDEFSHLNGEVSQIYTKGKGKPVPNWTIFNHTEILKWIAENEITDEPKES